MTKEFGQTPGGTSVRGPAAIPARPSPGKTTLVQLRAATGGVGAETTSSQAAHGLTACGLEVQAKGSGFDRTTIRGDHADHGPGVASELSVGKRTLTDQLAPVQRSASTATGHGDAATVHQAAAQGVAGPGSPLPHATTIQQLFGRHDISAVRAHVGGEATAASRAIGANAYATGHHVAFAGAPDLHTAAHEAAHVVQQRAGMAPMGGLDSPGDHLEQHADAVAGAVVGGRSAEDLLDRLGTGTPVAAVQRDTEKTAPEPNAVVKVVVFQNGKSIQHWQSRAFWKGMLPVQNTATRVNGRWTWDDREFEFNVETDLEGKGGKRVEDWAKPIADKIVVYVERPDAVTIDQHAKVTDGAPGHGKDKTSGGTTPGGSGHGSRPTHGVGHDNGGAQSTATHGSANRSDNSGHGDSGTQSTAGSGSTKRSGDSSPDGELMDGEHGQGHGNKPGGQGQGKDDRGDKGGGQTAPDPSDQVVEEFEKENDISADGEDVSDDQPGTSTHASHDVGAGEDDAHDDKPGTGTHASREKSAGGSDHSADPDGRTGGAGPGGKDARVGGKGKGSEGNGWEHGSEGGSKDGVKGGTAGGMFGGEGKAGDDGVPSGTGILGGLIAIQAALKAAVEVALILSQADITGAAGDLFKQGFREIVSVVAARKMVAHEARVLAAKETKAAIAAIVADKQTAAAWKAATAAERKAATRRMYWEMQRQYFDAFEKAAKQAQREARTALKKSAKDVAAQAKLEASALAEEVAAVKPIAGRLPVNHEFAGKAFPSQALPVKYRAKGHRLTRKGYPDFAPYAQKLTNGKVTVEIEYTGSHTADVAAANKKALLATTPEDMTWHHLEDGKSMMLVPSDLHDAVRHTGGVATYRHASGGLGYGN